MSRISGLILFISLICFLPAKAQKAIMAYMKNGIGARAQILSKQNPAYPVPSLDSADFIRTVSLPDSGMDQQLFVVRDYYKNTKPKMVGQSATGNVYVVLAGTCIEYYPNGHRKNVFNYEKGKPVGDFTEYFPNGKLYLEGRRDSAGKVIINSCNDSTGKVLVANGAGHCIKYSDEFRNVFAEGELVNGSEEGEWHGTLGNFGKYFCNYKKGVLQEGYSYDKDGNKHTFTTLEIEPAFKGGPDAFRNFLGRNIHYPTEAKKNNLQGKVFVSFVVNEDGHLSDFHIVRGVAPILDEETLRVVKASPPWIPGTQYGMPVRVLYTIPISYALSVADN